MLEKKRAPRDNDRAFREKGDEGFEADESTLEAVTVSRTSTAAHVLPPDLLLTDVIGSIARRDAARVNGTRKNVELRGKTRRQRHGNVRMP